MSHSLQGKLLIAMPALSEPTFAASVIYLCAHSDQGAMGFIINKPLQGTTFLDLADQINLAKAKEETVQDLALRPVLMGGPVEQQRGFVLHSSDYENANSLKVTRHVAVTSTLDILQDLAMGQGPQRFALALGYSGWSPGQLENEIKHNGWLHADANSDFIFHSDLSGMHGRALKYIGVDPAFLSSEAGHA
jgi:putative transcriptional regulator